MDTDAGQTLFEISLPPASPGDPLCSPLNPAFGLLPLDDGLVGDFAGGQCLL